MSNIISASKTTILIFIDWFYPGFKGGGPITSCLNLVSSLHEEFNLCIVTRDRDWGDKTAFQSVTTNYWTDFQNKAKVYYLSPSKMTLFHIFSLIREINPDVIYLNSMFSWYFTFYPLLIRRLFLPKKRILIAPRGMLQLGAIRNKQKRKEIYLKLLKTTGLLDLAEYHATDIQEKMDIEKYLGVNNPISVIPNFVKLSQVMPFQHISKKPEQLKLVYISRLNFKKNLKLLLEILERLNLNIQLNIVGPVDDEKYWQECQKVISRLRNHVEIIYLGEKKPIEIPMIIQANHVFVLLSEGENFGHVIFEALQSGRPVLISDQTPWKNLAIKQIGWDLPLSNPELIEKILKEIWNWDQEKFDIWALSAKQYADNYIKDSTAKQMYCNLFKNNG